MARGLDHTYEKATFFARALADRGGESNFGGGGSRGDNIQRRMHRDQHHGRGCGGIVAGFGARPATPITPPPTRYVSIAVFYFFFFFFESKHMMGGQRGGGGRGPQPAATSRNHAMRHTRACHAQNAIDLFIDRVHIRGVHGVQRDRSVVPNVAGSSDCERILTSRALPGQTESMPGQTGVWQ